MEDMARRQELARFVRSRRERLGPMDVGLPEAGRRRTPGLRREEVAGLADVSVTYYTWIEQARDVAPSRQVLESLARALRLSAAERAHLFSLGGQPLPPPAPDAAPERVHPALVDLLAALEPNPAYVINGRWDVLAYNEAEATLVFDFSTRPPNERNLIWLVFTDPEMRSRIVNWKVEAKSLLTKYRSAAAHHAGEEAFERLTDSLHESSEEFRQWWPQHDITDFEPSVKQFLCPPAGVVSVGYQKFQPLNVVDQYLLVYLPVDTESAERLQLLRRLTVAGADP